MHSHYCDRTAVNDRLRMEKVEHEIPEVKVSIESECVSTIPERMYLSNDRWNVRFWPAGDHKKGFCQRA